MKDSRPPSYRENAGSILIADLPFSTRSVNVLAASGIETLLDLAMLTGQELMRSPNLGRKSLTEIEGILAAHGLELGTCIFEPPQVNAELRKKKKRRVIDLEAKIEKSRRNAYRWYRELAEKGCPSAHNLLGYMHYTGKGASQSRVMAKNHFTAAAELGYALAACNQQLCVQGGVGQV